MGIGVGKSYLVSRLRVLLQAGRLHLPNNPEADMLIEELQDYQLEFTPAGNLTAAGRSGRHDELVLAFALAVALDLLAAPPTTFAIGRARGRW